MGQNNNQSIYKNKKKFNILLKFRINLENICPMECSTFVKHHTAVDIGMSGSSISHTLVESSLWLGYL